jgi:hypothetical protein
VGPPDGAADGEDDSVGRGLEVGMGVNDGGADGIEDFVGLGDIDGMYEGALVHGKIDRCEGALVMNTTLPRKYDGAGEGRPLVICPWPRHCPINDRKPAIYTKFLQGSGTLLIGIGSSLRDLDVHAGQNRLVVDFLDCCISATNKMES